MVHGAVQMMYADGEVSYHEKTAVNKIMKAANLTPAEIVRLKEDIRCSSTKVLIPSLSSNARRLYFLMIEYIFFSDDDIAEEEIETCKEYAILLRLKEAEDAIRKAQTNSYQISNDKLFKILKEIREKFAHISPTQGKSFE